MGKIKVEIDGMVGEIDEDVLKEMAELDRRAKRFGPIVNDFIDCLRRSHGNLEVEFQPHAYSEAWVLYFKAGHVHIKFNNEIIIPEALYCPGLDEVARKHNVTLMLAEGNNSTYSIN